MRACAPLDIVYLQEVRRREGAADAVDAAGRNHGLRGVRLVERNVDQDPQRLLHHRRVLEQT